MIIKGSARAAPGELAHHLLREDTNESVRVVAMSGVASLELKGALAELDGRGAGSRSKRTLYHASINTPIAEQLNADQQRIALRRLAEKLGLENQPYVVVEHVKEGRQHTHVVWSRIDVETGKAFSDSHNYRKHEEVSRALELEFGHGHVVGAHVRDKVREPRPQRGTTWGEQRQTERSGITPAAVKALVTDLWRQTSTGQQFRELVENEGFILARGDRRDFVLIDQAGELHGLTRRIEGARAKDVRERMADIDADQLPWVGEARQLLRARQPESREINFVTVVDRLRDDERRREREARSSGRAPLSNAHQEAADAIWQLNRTMRSQIEVIVPSHASQQRIEPPVPVQAAIPATPARETLVEKLLREARERGEDISRPPPKPLERLRDDLERKRVRRLEDELLP